MQPVPEPEVIPEISSVTVVCPECSELVKVRDVHAFLMGLHERVCSELELVNGAGT